MDSWLVVPCQRSRLDMLRRMLKSLDHPAGRVVIVTTHPDPIQQMDICDLAEHCVIADESEQTISRWWNLGLNYVQHFAQPRHEVLVLSSDNVGTVYSVAVLGSFLRQHNLTMAGPNPWHDQVRIYRRDDPRDMCDRVPGGCWMLAGESGLRIDEQFRWWYSDDDFEMQARHLNGAGIVPGSGLVGGSDTPLSDEKILWAIEDRQKFITKWGREPW